MSTTVVVKVRRLLDRNKAVAAGLTSFALAVATAAQNAIVSGDIDISQVEITGGGLVASLIIAGVTYLVSPGDAEVVLPDPPKFVPPRSERSSWGAPNDLL